MITFTQTFKNVENNINSLISNLGYKLEDLHTYEADNTMAVFASATYIEKSKKLFSKRSNKFIRLSIAPLRLEIDLDFGWGENTFTIYELYKLEGNFKFPERKYSLYEAMYDEKQLQFEFERLIKIFQLCGKRFLSNDILLKRDLEQQRQNISSVTKNEMISKKAEKAFKDHLWEDVVTLLTGKENSLSSLNQMRLKYAKKKIQKIK
ncbi:hypothetical protein [Leptospira brenneri]|uniref:hypothetical protein n=1 Tax=Leptospira brenneri TaxID=2023182 RepID=UPI000C29A389|nr:hypothetical protein [Leptospira brenneri]PJZ43784.1 hypothetical protein CH361_18705 [Leptospira brenneri]